MRNVRPTFEASAGAHSRGQRHDDVDQVDQARGVPLGDRKAGIAAEKRGLQRVEQSNQT